MIVLANGVMFDEELHKYWYKGKELSGITSVIKDSVSSVKYFSDIPAMQSALLEGKATHKAIQDYIETGNFMSNNPDAWWCKDIIDSWKYSYIQSETLVSDFKKYASAIDILGLNNDGSLDIYDIKRKFNRPYVEFQLNTYKYFVEKFSDYKVNKMVCISVKDRRCYPMEIISVKDIEKILYKKRSRKNV